MPHLLSLVQVDSCPKLLQGAAESIPSSENVPVRLSDRVLCLFDWVFVCFVLIGFLSVVLVLELTR